MKKNFFGNELVVCSKEPLTGFNRNGCCESVDGDYGKHIVCAQVDKKFLEFSYGNWKKPLRSSNKKQYLAKNFINTKKSYLIKTNTIMKKSNEKKHKLIKLKMVSPISWVLKLAEVKITNAIHNEAIETRNKNQEKYLFITKVVLIIKCVTTR